MRKKLMLATVAVAVLCGLAMVVTAFIGENRSASACRDGLITLARAAVPSSSSDWTRESLAVLGEAYPGVFSALILDPDGTATISYGDTASRPHGGAEEIAAALQDGLGLYRDSGWSDRFYVAQRLLDGGVLRVSASIPGNAYAAALWFELAIAAGAIFLLLLFGLPIAARADATLQNTDEASRLVAGGHYDVHFDIHGRDEFALIARSFEVMSQRLRVALDDLERKTLELESVIGSMTNGMLAVDAQMHIIQVNHAAKAMLTLSGNLSGVSLIEATRNARLEREFQTAMGHSELYTTEIPYRSDRRSRTLRLYITRLVRDEKTVGAMALIEDVTELRQLEQMRTDFVANVTHELRTPLTSIRGFVETLQGGAIEDPEAAKKFLDIIAIETDRLSRLINDILTLSAMQGSQIAPAQEPISLHDMASRTVEMLSIKAREKGLELALVSDGQDSTILGSRDHVTQLLLNLIDNAIKYTVQGFVRVSVALVRDEDGLDEVRLEVADSGIGISEEHVPRLFERFYRVDKGRSRSMGGTGLGLAIVKHIAAEMNAIIEVRSRPEQGTAFIVHIPHKPKDRETQPQQP